MAAPKCLVFLVGEGTSDIGGLANPPPYATDEPGFLQPLLRRMAPGLNLGFAGRTIRSIGRTTFSDPKHALGRQARQALALADVEEATVLVFATDVDKATGVAASKTERNRKLRELRSVIEAGFAAAIEAEPSLASILRITATPCRMVETWAAADLGAINAVGGDASEVPAKAPEDRWGDEQDPHSNHPKNVLRRALGKAAGPQDFADIANVIDCGLLSRTCPSFVHFDEGVRDALAACPAGQSVAR